MISLKCFWMPQIENQSMSTPSKNQNILPQNANLLYLFLTYYIYVVHTYLLLSKSNSNFHFQSEESRDKLSFQFLIPEEERIGSYFLSNRIKQKIEDQVYVIILKSIISSQNRIKDKRSNVFIFDQTGHFSSMPSENDIIGYPVVCGFFRLLTTHSKISAFVDIET